MLKRIPVALLCAVAAVTLLTGCITSLENPNLLKPIADPSKAEITGSKRMGAGPRADMLVVTKIDGNRLFQLSADPTTKLWPVEPGERAITGMFFGTVHSFPLLDYTTEITVKAELKAGVRYILKADIKGEMVTFRVEEAATGLLTAESAPVKRYFPPGTIRYDLKDKPKDSQ